MIELTLITNLAFFLFQDKVRVDHSQFIRMKQPGPSADMGCIITVRGPEPEEIWSKETCSEVLRKVEESK